MTIDQANEQQEEESMSPIQFRLYLLSSVFLALAVSLCLVIAVQVSARGYASFFGYSMFRVVTGSMEPTIPVNAVLLNKKTAIEDISEGDIICFRSREMSHLNSIVTHRVVSVSTGEDGAVYLQTRGDANVVSDPLLVDAGNLIGKVTWYTGKESVFTDMLSFLSGKIGFLALIVLPVLLISGLVLQGAGRSIRGELASALAELREAQSAAENTAAAPRLSDESDLLPGYTFLTRRDYEEIYQAVLSSFMEELHSDAEKAD